MDANTSRQINQLIRREVVPATGCTEPACVALAVAYAASLSPERAEYIDVEMSANMLKNAMGVGIPGTGAIGIPIAIALGAVIRRPELQLELLSGFTAEQLREAEALLPRQIITFGLKEDPSIDKLYVEARVRFEGGDEARCIIDRTHTGLRLLELNGHPMHEAEPLPASPSECSEVILPTEPSAKDIDLTFDLVYRYATEAPLEEIEFIYEAALQNKTVGEHALSGKFGHGVGRMIQSEAGQRLLGSSPLTHMLSYTSGACDARMDGAQLTVMSNSGSGNQGITATLPVLTFAESQGVSREVTTRALMMSSLMVVYVKQLLGRLSCLCGMVVSGIGSAAALVYIMGGSKEQSGYAVKNMIGNVTGMICDGAKPSCSLKASTGISSALISALLAMEQEVVTGLEGIVADDVDDCIRNLAEVGRDGMTQTDRKILEVMIRSKR
ncbi:serine dehydratase subunit alpha family protein [Porphyromonas sp. COT-239 OH1446]|uniref:L-cysteine desulfidase family protein n=1 Tax=Porphyromonas sp. COT-239 OH1446 TaxID=1515613 RepID=UPI00052C34E0|nr:L-serine ammonia-lyase, iron-sulfur-dependent, subunit alpha [Porphyromonas sp. COT-239 OH1446]KGN72004.1 membrane protein [Porphyromonas sp. COT-239 OH1446]